MIDKILEILTTLTDEAQNTARAKCNELGFDPNRGIVSLDESFINLNAAKLILTDAIEKQKLMQLPITVQKTILSNLESISKFLADLTNSKDAVINLVNSIEQLNIAIWQYGFHNLSEEVLGYQTKLNQLKNQDLEVKKLKAELDDGLSLKIKLEQFLGEVEKSNEKIQATVVASEGNLTKIAENVTQTNEAALKSAELLSMIQQTKKEADELSSSVSTSKGKVDTWAKEIQRLAEVSEEIRKNLNELEKKLSNLIETTENTYKKVEDLLPGATSAGLASAYRQRNKIISKSKWFWLMGFVLTLLGLLMMVIWIINTFQIQKENVEWWIFLLQRAPLTFPLIWLGWFFGRNYGHTVRLEEFYAFREVVSQSFEGYKKQMREVAPDKGLPVLCENVISILSESPLKVFDRKTTDETPANSLLERFMPKGKQSQKE